MTLKQQIALPTEALMHHIDESHPRVQPTFMFIGASKAGSSWFFEILREHPRVFVPANKATFFFTDYYEHGARWYEAFFTKAPEGSAVGEVCHDYLASPAALRRIRDYRPDMRVVCCLRNPYARALSSWRFFARNGLDEPTLTAQAERNPAVFDQGHYATQLKLLSSVFPKDQILIFFFEELAARPHEVTKRLYEFIGVDANFKPPSLTKRVNVNAQPRSRALARLVHNVHKLSWKRSRHLSNVIGHIKRIAPLRRAVRAMLYKHPIHSADWRDHLDEFPTQVLQRYEAEISELESVLGKNLSHWHLPPNHTSRLAACPEASHRPHERASESQPRVFDSAN